MDLKLSFVDATSIMMILEITRFINFYWSTVWPPIKFVMNVFLSDGFIGEVNRDQSVAWNRKIVVVFYNKIFIKRINNRAWYYDGV